MQQITDQPVEASQTVKRSLKPKEITALVLVVLLAVIGFYFISNRKVTIKPPYTSGYRLVNEKISQSASIVLHLPFQIDKALAQERVKFDPELKGNWVESDSDSEIVFKPSEKLKLLNFYAVELALEQPEESSIRSDFFVDEDPKILAIFPKENSETSENTEITIVFNRPMVPLSVLDQMENQNVPVEIIPATEGKFKWTTTRNLQFIPKERLIRSSNYQVKIKPGLTSLDGLGLDGKEVKFTTRNLRYLGSDVNESSYYQNSVISYNQPITIYFNQPVDLERIRNEVSLRDLEKDQNIPFVIEYGTKGKQSRNYYQYYDEYGQQDGLKQMGGYLADMMSGLGFIWGDENKSDAETDQSIIKIYSKADRFGRAKTWDFNNSYRLVINKAYPLEGDINLDFPKTINFKSADVISSISAQSDRTRYAETNFFDPQGKLRVAFYEEIDLNKSSISATKLKQIVYGEKCMDEQANISNCEKTEDKKVIYLTFKNDEIGLGESLSVNFEKIYNISGLLINKEAIRTSLTTYPEFKVYRTDPVNNSTGASLEYLNICSNSPILDPPKEDFDKYITANFDYEIIDWSESWKVTYKSDYEKVCELGEFKTRIYYGLMPKSSYSLQLNLEDVFGQKQNMILNFNTGEMPDQRLDFFHLQDIYSVTSPEKTKLTYAAENMEYVHINVCKVSATQFLNSLNNRLEWDEPTPNTICLEAIDDGIQLPKKYWIKNYFKVDIKDYFEDPIGNYILTFSHPNYKQKNWSSRTDEKVYERSYVTVTNLSVTEKRIMPSQYTYSDMQPLTPEQLNQLNNLYWVTNMSNLEPVSGSKVDLYKRVSNSDQVSFASSYYTNDQGVALTKVVPALSAAIISKGNDSTVIFSSMSRFDWASEAYNNKRIYLYTDKPIYRPNQEVSMKGIYRLEYDGNYEIYQGKNVKLTVFNPRSDEIFTTDTAISDFGTFNASFILPENAALGNYRYCINDSYSCGFFDVEEYVPAPFEVTVQSDKEEYISKDTANLEINAKYYFGVALDSGEVTYTVSSQNYYFDRYDKEYFHFGTAESWWYYYNYGDKFLLRGKAELDSNGKAKISQLLDFEGLFKEDERKSKIIVFDVTVKNSQGQSISSQKSFLVHAGEFYLGIKTDKYFVGKNESFNVKVKSVDTKGKEIRVRNGSLALYKIEWDYAKRQEAGGGYAYTWQKKRDLVTKSDFETDASGNYIKEMKIDKEGQYEIEASAKDTKNNLVRSSYTIYVYGEGSVSVRPTSDTELEIEAEKNNLNVNEEARIIIKSPYPKAKALIAVERGKIFDYQIKEIQGNLYNYNFLIKEEYIPNIYVTVLLMSENPEVKYGKLQLDINTDEKELDISVTPNKKTYLPGESITLDVLAKDNSGNPVSAELSLAVVDLSVLALKGNPKKDPVSFFYGGFPLTVSTASNIKNILIEPVYDTKGGGGTSEEALAVKKRGIFKETAFWQAIVNTDSKGKASITFTLPDNLTTWQAEALGITKDTKVGVAYEEFMTKKDLMVVPLKPRFVLPGDEFYVGAQIFNQSDSKQNLSVSFDSLTLSLLNDKGLKEIKLDSNKSETVYFNVKASSQMDKGEHKFIISVKGKGLEDTVEMSIVINRNNTYETIATSNYTNKDIAREYIYLPDYVIQDRGSLSVKSSATLAVFLSDSLNYLLQFPYGCSEQLASKLNGIAVVKKGLNIPNLSDKLKLEKIKDSGMEYTIEQVVDITLAKLYANQQWDGGFALWVNGESSYYTTLHVLDTLNNLSQAGFPVNQNSISRAASYLTEKVRSRFIYEDERGYRNRLIMTSYTLFSLPSFQSDNFLKDEMVKIINNNAFLQDQANSNSLSYLAMIASKAGFSSQMKDKVFNVLDNKLQIDARGASLNPGRDYFWRYYETPIKDTSLYLKAQVADKRDNTMNEKVLRWLLNSREKDGAWGSTNNTVSVIDAMTDFLVWKRETESNFSFNLAVNDKNEGSFEFNADTILDQFKTEIPVSQISFDKINTVTFSKKNNNQLANNLYYDMALRYYLPADQIAPRDEGFSIERNFYSLEDKENKTPVLEATVGEPLRAHLKITVPDDRRFVAIEDYIPAGMEIINLDLATEQKSLRLQEKEEGVTDRELYPDYEELRDDRAFFFKEELYPGVYEYDYFVRPLIKGKFTHLPAVVSEMYFPENFGRTNAGYFVIK